MLLYLGLHLGFIVGFIVGSKGQDRACPWKRSETRRMLWHHTSSTRPRQSGSCFVPPNPVRHTLIILCFNSTTTLLPDRTSFLSTTLQFSLAISHFDSEPHFNHSARTSIEPLISPHLTLQLNPTSIISSHLTFQFNPTSSILRFKATTSQSPQTSVQRSFNRLTL